MMGIYIKGMEMPTSCAFCRFNGAYCYAKGDENVHSTLPCPLVPVSPHGDLIERDALMDQIVHDTPLSAVFEKTMRRYLHNAPTIIPAEEEDNDRT